MRSSLAVSVYLVQIDLVSETSPAALHCLVIVRWTRTMSRTCGSQKVCLDWSAVIDAVGDLHSISNTGLQQLQHTFCKCYTSDLAVLTWNSRDLNRLLGLLQLVVTAILNQLHYKS